jgi:hypothetical protein
VQIFDNNGGTLGDWYQKIGPVTYTGAENLALGKTVTADPGWHLMTDPAKLVDGRIQYPTGNDGFAWAIGGLPGTWKQATVDFGTPTEFNKVVIWHRFPKGIPSDWKIQYSNDGAAWTDVFVPTTLTCRTATTPLNVSMYNPSCAYEADFVPVTAQYVRYFFDKNTTFDGKRGWALEFEVFNIEDGLLDPAELIERAIEVIQDIVDSNPGTPLADKLEDALHKVQTALDELTKSPPDNQAAVGNIEGVIGDIEASVKDGFLDSEEGVQLMSQLVQAARQLAEGIIQEAIDQGQDPQIIAEAQKYLEEGDALRGEEKFKDAVNKYKDALAKAESVLN